MYSLSIHIFWICIYTVVTLADINLNVYNNTVLYGTPFKVIALDTLSYTFPFDNMPFSAQILGSITWPTDVDKYYIDCVFDTNLRGVVKIDDHLICAPNIYPQTQFEFWNLTWTSTAYQTRKSFIRIDLYSTPPQDSWNDFYFKILWSFNDNSSFELINSAYLSNNISMDQQRRMQLQQKLTHNSFSTWFIANMLSIIRMPDRFGFTFGICDGSNSSDCLLQDIIENDRLWVGAHAYDHSYYEYNITYNQYNIQYQYSSVVENATYSDLYVKIKLLSTTSSAPFIAYSSRLYWGAAGDERDIDTVYGDMHCFMRYNGFGLPQYFDMCSNINYTKTQDDNLLFEFNDVIYFTTDSNIAFVSDIDVMIDKYAALEYSRYEPYGNLNDTKKAIQSGLMWNLVYTPEESGPYFPVARAWATAPNDYDMIIFEWDTIFASYQLSLDAFDLSISNLIQVIKSKTCHGFVPNYKGHGKATEDRTEPPIGSMVLDKMYDYRLINHDISWVVRLLFYDLYDWVNWFWERRRCAPKYLICLGSDPNIPDVRNGENNMQAARYESGLDNSPMYDGDFFNTTTHHMMLYDVGMTSLFMNELKHLHNLGQVIEVDDDILRVLKERYDIMLSLTLKELWNDKMGIFMNKWTHNDTFYDHISPTSFYPLLTGDVDADKVESMVHNYLMNPDYFCISYNFPLNQSSDCYYGLPSIAKSDMAFKSQGYWRGLAWGPMVQLVWW
eukprot:761057_1